MSLSKLPSRGLEAGAVEAAMSTPLGMRNRIINGDMRIDQRYAGVATSSNINNNYTLDRWKCSGFTVDSTVQQVSDSPIGFSKSLKYTVVSAVAPGPANTEVVAQGIEGYNSADLEWGTSNAKTITLSFWVKSSLTGSFCVSISNATNPRAISSADRSYVTAYTISSANTWEYKTITISGDTTGTWDTTIGSGIAIQFPFGIGSTYSTSSSNTWQAGSYAFITGTQNVTETAGATWQITGVQLEEGSVATDFERRPYGLELMLCQRYYHTMGGVSRTVFATCVAHTSDSAYGALFHPVTMRSSPSMTAAGSYSDYYLTGGSGQRTITGLTIEGINPNTVTMVPLVSGLTIGYGYWFNAVNTTAKLAFNAEL